MNNNFSLDTSNKINPDFGYGNYDYEFLSQLRERMTLERALEVSHLNWAIISALLNVDQVHKEDIHTEIEDFVINMMWEDLGNGKGIFVFRRRNFIDPSEKFYNPIAVFAPLRFVHPVEEYSKDGKIRRVYDGDYVSIFEISKRGVEFRGERIVNIVGEIDVRL